MDLTELYNYLKTKTETMHIDDEEVSGKILFDLTGQDACQWWVVIADGKASFSTEPLSEADLTVTASTDTAHGLFKKTVNPVMAFLTGKVKVRGDQKLIDRVKKLLAFDRK